MKMKPKHIKLQDNIFLLVLAGLLIAISASNSAFAQEALRLQPSGQPGDKKPPLIEEKPPGPPPSLKLPPPPSPKEKVPDTLPLESVYIRKIKVAGSTV